MKYLFRHWGDLKKKIIASCIILFLDYDGTLTPIVDKPYKAHISLAAKAMLKKLSQTLDCKLAIISGRSLKDIEKNVGVKDIVYAGNHGLEIKGPGLKFTSITPLESKKIIALIKANLKNKLSSIPGVLLEDKGPILSLHYRLVDDQNISMLKDIFNHALSHYVKGRQVRITRGKKVLEVRPAIPWNKGMAVRWLLAKEQAALKNKKLLPVYIGDDVTDEDAFKALGSKGVTIFVGGNKSSAAQFYLKDALEVYEFLKQVLQLKTTNTYG